MQRGSQFSDVYDLCRPSKNRFNHHEEEWTLKKKRISITIRAGALMDLTVSRNVGFSGCAA
jgi:3-hydroxy-3-methylglutaryl CoA synthase